ncbi:MAG: orotate phosphoribosyltransferase [Candidatus Methanoperedens sp.]|nr:orotate phosphoribosyltransferase [Candidatus Methanoperedens sp.]
MTGLADTLKECGAIKFGNFTLASGKKSDFYVDIKKASMNPEILKMIACRVRDLMETRSISGNYIACVALGGVPIAVSVSLETGLPLVIIRKESKEYGAKGQIVGEIEKGRSAILVEDVTTTGGSILKAIKILRDEGMVINHVITVVDRDEGAFKNLADADVRLTALVSIKELLKK